MVVFFGIYRIFFTSSKIKFKSTGLINDYYSTYFSYNYRESYEQYQSRANEDQYRISFQDNPNEYDLKQRYVFLSGNEADYVGMAKTYYLSAILIASGVLIAIIFPTFWPSLFGFCLVGVGTAPIFPMTFILAGTSNKYSAGMAISIITTYAIVGMLIGPPLIGYLAHAFGLKSAFIIFKGHSNA